MSCNENVYPCAPCSGCVEPVNCDELNYTNTDTCPEIVSLGCIQYGGVNLPCINVLSTDSLATIFSKINTKVCAMDIPINVTNTDHTIGITASGYNNHTLVLNTSLSTTAGNILIKNATGLYVPTPVETPLTVTDSTTIDLTTSGTVNHTLTAAVKISTTAGNALSVVGNGLFVATPASVTETTLVATDSSTIDFTTSGTRGHNLTGSVKISTIANNLITSDSTGIYALMPSGYVRETRTINGLDLTADRILTTTNINEGTNLYFTNVRARTAISVTGALTYNSTTGVIGLSSYAETSLVVTDSTTIDFTNSGTAGHNLTGQVKISATSGNAVTVDATGLYVATGAGYLIGTGLVNTSNTISVDPVQAITRISTLTTDGLIKTTSGNGTLAIATAGTDYQSPITLTTTGTSGAATLIGNTLNIPQYTGGSGTVTTVSVVSANGFGGTVSNHTTTPAITLTTSVTGILKGDGTGVSAAVAGTDFQIPITVSNGMSYSSGAVTLGGSLTGNTTITGGTYYMAFLGSIGTINQSNTPFSAASTITTTGTETAQYIMSGVSGALVVNNASTFTPYSSSKHGAVSGSVYKNSAGNWSGNLAAIYGCVEVAGTGNVTTSISVRAYKVELTTGQTFGGTITNAVGVYIDDFSTSTVSGSITNRYSIYQAGASDINLLNGYLRMVNLPVYADNTAASSLATGTFYRTSTGTVMVKY